jgi:predicted PurR-regulated permease PerM
VLQQGGTVATLAAFAFGGIFGVFLTLTLLAYFLASGRQVLRGLLRLFPPDWRPLTARIFDTLRPILFRYFAGIAAVVVYAGCAAYIGLGLFLGLRHAAFLAALTGLLEVLPVVGPALSAVIAGLVAVQEAKSLWSIAAYVIYASGLGLSIDQLVGPLVLGNAARVHPTLVIFCFLAGGALFGIAGVILAVPFALTVKVTLAMIYREPIGGRR